jgi:hypothetical protein
MQPFYGPFYDGVAYSAGRVNNNKLLLDNSRPKRLLQNNHHNSLHKLVLKTEQGAALIVSNSQ